MSTPIARGRALTVVIPAYNEAKGIDALVAALTPELEATGLAWDVVFVDDGSRDETLLRLRDLHARDARFTAIALSRNFGKEIAVAAGLTYARGDAVVIMDADLQHPPDVIHRFLAKWREGYDVVYGQRDDREADSPFRRLFSRGFYRLFAEMSGTVLPDGAGDFRLLDRRAVDAMNRIGERARFNKGLYAWIGFNAVGVDFHVPPRHDGGGSRWRPRQLWRFALDGLISFSTIPLRVWSYIGLVVSSVAFAYVVIFFTKTLIFGADVPGFPTLIISVLFLGGMQLISLGVIGEYLGRIYEEVKDRPLFLVSEEIGTLGPARPASRPRTPAS
ncbi:MAG TPA: glycosyltransferase family 2 protein [Hyphomicrobiaceae bacterium]|nr:glycosyltransferase family 2 protein [Hyphomicrobiaceae bacterium]